MDIHNKITRLQGSDVLHSYDNAVQLRRTALLCQPGKGQGCLARLARHDTLEEYSTSRNV